MKAIVCKEFGPPEKLVYEETPPLSMGKSAVRVAVKAVGVNFPDTLMIRDLYQFKPGDIGFVMIAVFRLGQLPRIVSAIQFGHTLKSSHIFIGLIGQRKNTLHILRFGVGVVVPVNKTFVFKPRTNRKVQIRAINSYP